VRSEGGLPRRNGKAKAAPCASSQQRQSRQKKTPAAIATPCDGMRAVSDVRPAFAGLPRKGNQIASLSSFEARNATFLLALI
jgi:hypothetical protein